VHLKGGGSAFQPTTTHAHARGGGGGGVGNRQCAYAFFSVLPVRACRSYRSERPPPPTHPPTSVPPTHPPRPMPRAPCRPCPASQGRAAVLFSSRPSPGVAFFLIR
jgi:hypothetical protein